MCRYAGPMFGGRRKPLVNRVAGVTQKMPAARREAGQRAGNDQLSRCTIVQLMEKPELPNLPPPGPVIRPS